jgi:hypothetical protein
MAELVLLGIAEYACKGSPLTSSSDVIALSSDFDWLRLDP